MGSQATNWGSIANEMLTNNANFHQRQSQVDIQKAEEQRRAQDSDIDFAQTMIKAGALPVVNGVVKRQLKTGGGPGGAAASGTVLDTADPSRTVKWKDASGKPVMFEMPPLHEQLAHQWEAGAPERAGQVAQKADEARATGFGTSAGKAQADDFNLDQYGITPTDAEADKLGIPRGQKILRSELTNLAGKNYSVQSAGIRADATRDVANTRAGVSERNAQLRATTEEKVAGLKTAQAEEALKHRDRWESVRAGLQKQAESGRNSRAAANLRGIDAAERLHGAYLGTAEQAEEKQARAEALLGDHEETGFFGGKSTKPDLEDNEEFTDPFTGKKSVMNTATRNALAEALKASKLNTASLRERADGLLQRYGAPGAPTIAPKATGKKITIKTSDNQTLLIPEENLKKAQQRDPKLQIISQ